MNGTGNSRDEGCAAKARLSWRPRPGDRCTLVCLNVRDGSEPIKPGVIETVRGHHAVVVTDDGGRYSVETDSSFLKGPSGG